VVGVSRRRPFRADRACHDATGTDAFDAAGGDVTLIDWMLSLTPRERLEALFAYASSTARLTPSARSDRSWAPADSVMNPNLLARAQPYQWNRCI
jgi:hypothetical protein